MSRVTAYIHGLIESGWLIALVIVPLFFNVYSYRVFEPDKLGLLRTIVTVMAALALVLLAENWLATRRGTNSREWLRSWIGTPLVAPALAIAGIYILSTIWSVSPRTSLMGSYQRLQGTYSMLSYIVLFGCMLALTRERAQVERVLTVVVLTSLPVALYGLLQHHGLDPLPWQGDVTTRVASTMGNAIFVGAYLIMAIPLTAGRWLMALRQVAADATRADPVVISAEHVVLLLVQTAAWAMLSFSQATMLMLLLMALSLLAAKLRHRDLASQTVALVSGQILAVQLVALLFCGSRGPQIGLLVGIVLFALLGAAVARRRRMAVGIVTAGLSLLGVLITLNLPQSPLAGVRNLPYVGQLGRLLEMDAGTGKVRTLIWEGAVALLRDNPLRAVTGYGPETMYVVYNRYYPAELAHYESRTASPDRSHNETFDALITTGALGLLAYLSLFVALFLHGFTALGLTASRLSRRAFIACSAAGGILGAGLPVLLVGSPRLSGVGLPIGMVSGHPALCRLPGCQEKHGPYLPGGLAESDCHSPTCGDRGTLGRDLGRDRDRVHSNLLLGVCGPAGRRDTMACAGRRDAVGLASLCWGGPHQTQERAEACSCRPTGRFAAARARTAFSVTAIDARGHCHGGVPCAHPDHAHLGSGGQSCRAGQCRSGAFSRIGRQRRWTGSVVIWPVLAWADRIGVHCGHDPCRMAAERGECDRG